jgi:hypothetical protein
MWVAPMYNILRVRVLILDQRLSLFHDFPLVVISEIITGTIPSTKRPGREVDHSPPTSAEVKKMWIYTSTPHTPSCRSA